MLQLLLCTLLVQSHLCAESPQRARLVEEIEAGFARLDTRYWSPTLGIWFNRPGDDLRAHFEGRNNPTWWPSANAVETLIDASAATGVSRYFEQAETVFTLNRDYKDKTPRLVAELRKRNQWTAEDDARIERRAGKATSAEPDGYYVDFRNEYLDDSGWWGVAWLKMYDRTRDAKYLATARSIHAHMAKNWKPERGGGVVWCEDADKQIPNAITNQLFAILSARLHARTKEPAYLDWAKRTLEWTRAQKLFDGTGIVDAPGHKGDHWCTNQGTYIGMLAALFEATGDAAYLDAAAAFTDAVLARGGLLTKDGVLIEKLGTSGDASLFKGVFARYLAQLRDVLKVRGVHTATCEKIDSVLAASAASALKVARGEGGYFKAEWHEGAKDQSAGFNSQVSVLAALVGALEAKP